MEERGRPIGDWNQFRANYEKMEFLTFENFLALSDEKRDEIIASAQKIVLDRLMVAMRNNFKNRRCFDGVAPFSNQMYGWFDLKLDYQLAYVLRGYTILMNLSLQQMLHYFCGKENSSVELMIASLLNLTPSQRLLLILLKPLAKSHTILSHLLRGRNDIENLNEYDKFIDIDKDAMKLITIIAESKYSKIQLD